MPELPEVEITRKGLSAQIAGQTIADVIVRNASLRWPIPKSLPRLLRGLIIRAVNRRAKYLMLDCGTGTLILHLGMSGSLRVLTTSIPAEKHDHFDLVMCNGTLVRLHDPRRFGAVLWHEGDVSTHPLFALLGPEPMNEKFDASYLYRATRGRRISIKQCIMDGHVVVGVGNIYANEALFRSGIRPQLAAGKLSQRQCTKLVDQIRATLSDAIDRGGSTLRDFVNSAGQPGYFQQNYWVYGRAGKPCKQCGLPIRQIRQGQRSSFFCRNCQK